MSKFTQKPYIELVLAELSGDNKAVLLNNINGKNAAGNADISYTLKENVAALASVSAGVTPVEYRYSPTITWKGYAVKTAHYTIFITFKNSVDLSMAEIFIVSSSGMGMVETVTADNLRALLREDSYIDSSEAASMVEANPTLAGTEASLESIEINGTKYKISSGDDILSQIEYAYDEETSITRIVFPKGIMPLRCIDENYPCSLYFDYKNKIVLNDVDGEGTLEECGDMTYNPQTGRFTINLTTFNVSISLIHVAYLLFGGADDTLVGLNFNSYDLLNYRGLYRYDVHLLNYNGWVLSFNFVSSNPNLVPGATKDARFSNLVSCLDRLGYNSADNFLSCFGIDQSSATFFDRVYATTTTGELKVDGTNTAAFASNDLASFEVTVTKLK